MGYADKAKAGGNTTEGPITDYAFMDTFPFGEDQEPDGNIYMLLEITPDGAEEALKRSLYLGSGQYLRIEDDGKTLVSNDDDGTPRLYENGEVYKFIASLEDAGFPAESRFPDLTEEKRINFEGMVDYGRIRLVNEIDVEATKAYGKRKVTKGKHKGKEFNRTYTKVTKFWAPGEFASANGNGNGAHASAKKTTPASQPVKGRAVPVEDDGDDVSDKVADRVLGLVMDGAKNNTIKVVDIALAVTRLASKSANKIDEGTRDVLRRRLADKVWLADAAERLGLEFDNKKGVLSAS